MSISRLRAKLRGKMEQLKNVREDIALISNLVDNVEYAPAEQSAMADVGCAYVSKAQKLDSEVYVISQMLEVLVIHETMESNNALH